MSDIALDPNTGDLLLLDNGLTLTEGLESRRQHLEIRLKTFLEEWFLDTSVGVPYLQRLFTQKNPDTLLVQSVIREQAEKTPGITSITKFDFEINNATRNLVVELGANSVDGEFEIIFEQGV